MNIKEEATERVNRILLKIDGHFSKTYLEQLQKDSARSSIVKWSNEEDNGRSLCGFCHSAEKIMGSIPYYPKPHKACDLCLCPPSLCSNMGDGGLVHRILASGTVSGTYNGDNRVPIESCDKELVQKLINSLKELFKGL